MPEELESLIQHAAALPCAPNLGEM